MTRSYRLILAAPLALACLLATGALAEDLTISEIMKKAHRGRDATVQKAIRGEASKEEMQTLLDYYKAMLSLKPPRGEEAEWKKRVEELIQVATEVSKGTEDAGKKLQTVANCKDCHTAHRPQL